MICTAGERISSGVILILDRSALALSVTNILTSLDVCRNFARYSLDRRLYKVVTKYLDFQKYLSEHFKDISHLSLSELVKIFCNDQIFR